MGLMLPVIVAAILLCSFLKKGNTYSDFLEGARQGLVTAKDIFAPLLAISVASSMLRASGAFDVLVSLLSPVLQKASIPPEVLPLALIKPVSGSGALSVLSDTLNTYGADSRIGKIASVMMASTETTFYCISIYFSKTGIKNTSRAIPCAVAADVFAFLLACALIK